MQGAGEAASACAPGCCWAVKDHAGLVLDCNSLGGSASQAQITPAWRLLLWGQAVKEVQLKTDQPCQTAFTMASEAQEHDRARSLQLAEPGLSSDPQASMVTA